MLSYLPSSSNHDLTWSFSSGGRVRSRNRSRCYGPRSFEDEFHMYEKQDEIQAVVAKIQKFYILADLNKVKLDSGYCCCFGLLDPISNIRVNGCIYDVAAAAAAAPGKGSENIAKRSLDGLVAFLTCLFPYLPDAEAVRYLDAAEADPLVAVLHIIKRRGMVKTFDKNSATTVAAVKAALRCAAFAAQHPDPQRFMEGWKNVSPGVGEFAIKLSRPLARFEDGSCAVRLIGTPTPEFELEVSWELANGRFAQRKAIDQELPPARAAMKRMLLATIHRFYLQALGSLPKHELRERLHHSMLQGGHCYGPLDPVSNIIVNTMWYDQKFPSSKQVTLQMISTQCLWRAAARSLYGLVSFLCTRYPSLTPDQALQRLLHARANLQDADPYLFVTPEQDNNRLSWSGSLQIGSGKPEASHKQRRTYEETAPSASVLEAYIAAATAAFHPNPLSQKEFLGSPNTVANLQTARRVMRLQDGRLLSSKDLEILCMHIFECPSSAGFPQKHPESEPKKVNMVLYTHVSKCRRMFWGQQERASRMVATALRKLNETVEPHYALHVICGVNELVSGPEFSLGISGDYNLCGSAPNMYRHSHINFLATRKGEHATLFFAECENHGTGAWCVPVSLPQRNGEPDVGVNPDAATDPCAEQVRCIYCEHNGNRIVHPAVSGFHGRDNFVDLFYGSDRYSYSNNKAVMRGLVDWVDGLEDDAIHVNFVPADEMDPDDVILLDSQLC
ncbi:unnamed protein product [Urochloa decumbens]|uniref:Uncharacterized protein n=1 Tax=Urochloa decumbens TaxID=240449 RepID=A0ABC9DQR9_9POAL